MSNEFAAKPEIFLFFRKIPENFPVKDRSAPKKKDIGDLHPMSLYPYSSAHSSASPLAAFL